MANTITLTQTAYKELLNRLSKLEKMMATLLEKLKEEEPPYGTEAWWEWSIKKGKEDIKKGRYTTLKTHKDIDRFFESL